MRLPAHLTASGRAILAHLSAAQVRALYPDRAAFVDRHGLGPGTPSALRTLLAETRQRGYAVEEGEVTPGFASVAGAVLDHNGHPVAGIAVTYPSDDPPDRPRQSGRCHPAYGGGGDGAAGRPLNADQSRVLPD